MAFFHYLIIILYQIFYNLMNTFIIITIIHLNSIIIHFIIHLNSIIIHFIHFIIHLNFTNLYEYQNFQLLDQQNLFPFYLIS